jgi:hypothetical protein
MTKLYDLAQIVAVVVSGPVLLVEHSEPVSSDLLLRRRRFQVRSSAQQKLALKAEGEPFI